VVAQVRWAKSRTVEALRRVRLLAACSRRELAEIGAVAVPAQVPAGTVLTREGEIGGLAYIIESGMCDVFRDGKRVLGLGPGDIAGELSLLDGGPRTATVQSATDVHLLQISHRDLEQVLRRAPNLRRSILQTLAERVRDVDMRVSDMS